MKIILLLKSKDLAEDKKKDKEQLQIRHDPWQK